MNTSPTTCWLMDRRPENTGVSAFGSSLPFSPRNHPNNFSRIGAVYPGHGTPTPWLTEIGTPPFDGSEFDAYSTFTEAKEAVIAGLPVRTVWVEESLPNAKIFYWWTRTEAEIQTLDNDVYEAVTNDPRLLSPLLANQLCTKLGNHVVNSLDIDITLLRLRRRGLID